MCKTQQRLVDAFLKTGQRFRKDILPATFVIARERHLTTIRVQLLHTDSRTHRVTRMIFSSLAVKVYAQIELLVLAEYHDFYFRMHRFESKSGKVAGRHTTGSGFAQVHIGVVARTGKGDQANAVRQKLVGLT